MYNWSKMTGKLEGIPALNTDTTSNKYCQSMNKNSDPTKKEDPQYDYIRIERRYANCSHPYTKQGCCDICGKDLIGE